MSTRRYTTLAILVCAAVLCASAAYYSGALGVLQDKFFDRFFVTKAAPHTVVVIAIDDESIEALGGWPLSRATLAQALDNLHGAAAIGFDLVLADPSSRGAQDDAAFAAALGRATFPVVVPFQFDERGGKTIEPLALFAGYSVRGYANVALDQDGVVRRFEPQRQNQLSFAAALLPSTTLPAGYVRIDYRGPAKTVLTIPFVDLYRGKVPAAALQDKLVLVGATAPDLHDSVQTPFGVMPGVEVQANALSTLEAGRFFTATPGVLVFFALLLAAALAALLIVWVKRLWLLLSLLASGLASTTLLAIVLFGQHILFPNLAVSLAFVLAVGGVLVYQYLAESKEKKFIRETFQYYLMPEVIDQLVADPTKLALGGERRGLTILFSDIRGFTSISEGLTPEQLMEIMNEYLTAMTDVILHTKGLVDKYIGDAVMAFWGAPLPNPRAAIDACRSVLLMSQALQKLNIHWAERGLPHLQIGVGINAGEVIVGNMGSNKRFNYTVMGDEVNFASRLENLNKVYGTQCLISESVQKQIAHSTSSKQVGEADLCVRELDRVLVQGKKEPKLIFELITQPVDEVFEQVLGEFAKGRVEYVAGEWHKASEHFKAALALRPDPPSQLFLERCAHLLQSPPVQWDGVYEFTTK